MPNTIKHFIGGDWVSIGSATSPVYNPSVGEVIAETPLAGAEALDQAVTAAAEAFPAWKETPAIERCRVLFRLKMLLEDQFDDIAKLITREHGKTITESRGDLRRGIEVVEFACGIPSLLMGETAANIARGIDCEAVRHPLGVVAGITPFNFPAMVPMWMFPIAIACGNTFILKPSEKVPLTATRIGELLVQAGLPKGVLNIVHGGKEIVDAILKHPTIKAVSFVGSTPIAKYIYETGARHGKRVQAAGGAKNHIFIMPDADIDNAVKGLTEAAFGCAGERCMSGSTAVVIGPAGDKVVPAIARVAQQLVVGATDRDPNAQMGPVISAPHRDRVRDLIGAGVKGGATAVADGRNVTVAGAPNGFYVGATVLDGVQPDMTIHSEEIFGPVLNVIRVNSLSEGLAIQSKNPYGNGACIFTRSGATAREFKHNANAGMIGINVGVPAPMAFFPFSGWNESFFGDLHVQGREGVAFYTQQKVTTTRWFASGEGDIWSK
ncbi:MAG TPA: CoA-acylating methylmalonate-semialdehyde dehydrogenase [Tepidisphaeraceae bacterium]|jgi:malonate-semialdehyde dehydrogenase (acetylating)/methylmalonate-semialdehyde dehydrogenase|nr:CoA-acylating methylmalonate-semialdehyde dehydrogenase [Tepidisphaeraceae bacterium]